MSSWHVKQAARIARSGGIIAYPTEAVYGLGCDPYDRAAVLRLLELKQRTVAKGLILIAGSMAHLRLYVRELEDRLMDRVKASWPGPTTWLLPARHDTPGWLTGHHETVAVRITAHGTAAALCARFGGALVSTSANRAGGSPARTALEVRVRFGRDLDYVLPGVVGGAIRPSEIRDARTGCVIRPG